MFSKSSCQWGSWYSSWGVLGCLCSEYLLLRRDVRLCFQRFSGVGCCVFCGKVDVLSWVEIIQLEKLYLGKDYEERWVSDWNTLKVGIPNTILVMLECASSWFLYWGEVSSGCILFCPCMYDCFLELEYINDCCHRVGGKDARSQRVNTMFVIHTL